MGKITQETGTSSLFAHQSILTEGQTVIAGKHDNGILQQVTALQCFGQNTIASSRWVINAKYPAGEKGVLFLDVVARRMYRKVSVRALLFFLFNIAANSLHLHARFEP
ncbi:MAG: hypothetical protein GF398_08780 [Chitinivibrionales bacterium]|nr:hypothetical protein [Chitinivibrionales bacterium]